MGFRFRRSVKLFPGVRLNLSRGGISTTIGVRGAGVTLGPRGAYANVGLPGTGLSYRTRISPTPTPASHYSPEFSSLPPRYDPEIPSQPLVAALPGAEEIHSGSVSAMTSPGLSELKRLINEASIRKNALTQSVADKNEELQAKERKLALAKSFIIRLFTKKAVPKLDADIQECRAKRDETEDELEGCYIHIDFALDEATTGTFAALSRSFEGVRTCQKIWDITESAKTDRIKERTTATSRVTRTLVGFDFSDLDIVRSDYRSMRLTNASSFEIHFYPGFVLTKETGSDFALVEWNDLSVEYAPSRFIETDPVPTDSEVVGHTWAKANKDGSPDRRFADNYQIPIAKYGELWLRSPTGIYEAYMISNPSKVEDFAAAVSHHKDALTKIDHVPYEAPPEESEVREDAAPVSPQPDLQTEQTFYLDWIAVALLIVAVVVGGYWVTTRAPKLLAEIQSSRIAAASPNPGQEATPRPVMPAVYVVPKAINIRSQPSASAHIAQKASQGDTLSVFQVRGRWTQVGSDHPVGWVLSKLVRSKSDNSAAVINAK